MNRFPLRPRSTIIQAICLSPRLIRALQLGKLSTPAPNPD